MVTAIAKTYGSGSSIDELLVATAQYHTLVALEIAMTQATISTIHGINGFRRLLRANSQAANWLLSADKETPNKDDARRNKQFGF